MAYQQSCLASEEHLARATFAQKQMTHIVFDIQEDRGKHIPKRGAERQLSWATQYPLMFHTHSPKGSQADYSHFIGANFPFRGNQHRKPTGPRHQCSWRKYGYGCKRTVHRMSREPVNKHNQVATHARNVRPNSKQMKSEEHPKGA